MRDDLTESGCNNTVSNKTVPMPPSPSDHDWRCARAMACRDGGGFRPCIQERCPSCWNVVLLTHWKNYATEMKAQADLYESACSNAVARAERAEKGWMDANKERDEYKRHWEAREETINMLRDENQRLYQRVLTADMNAGHARKDRDVHKTFADERVEIIRRLRQQRDQLLDDLQTIARAPNEPRSYHVGRGQNGCDSPFITLWGRPEDHDRYSKIVDGFLREAHHESALAEKETARRKKLEADLLDMMKRAGLYKNEESHEAV